MRATTCSLAWCVIAMLAAAAAPDNGWITGPDGLREVRVPLDRPVDPGPDAVTVRAPGRRPITGFDAWYDEASSALVIEFSPALRAPRVTIVLDDALAGAAGRAVLNYTVLAGDATRDGVVDARDVQAVLDAIGTCTPDDGAFDAWADLDGDGCVGPDDLAVVAANMRAAAPGPARHGRRAAAAAPPAPDPPQAALPVKPVAWIDAGPSTTSARRVAIYDEGQTGSLPPVSVVRDAATIDTAGAAVAPDQPRWGRRRLRAPLHEWSLVRPLTDTVTWVAAGFDTDGVTPMICYLQENLERVNFWIDTSIGGGNPTFTIDVQREIVQDILAGSPLQQDFYAYEPEAGLVLPGCFLFLCQRWHDVNEDLQFRHWQIEGITVIAMQRDANGDFAMQIVGDGPPLNNDSTALGMERCHPLAMTAYYPFTEGQDPLLRAFIPVTDYINHFGAKPGGQLFLVEATRPDAQTAWSFGELFLVDEHVENGTHFHTAAWTPRGVVLAMGDAEINENFIYTCADWDDYANPFLWTKHERVYGAGTHADAPALTLANQFGGAVPGRDPNHVLVGPDIAGSGVFECAVPEDPADGLTFTRLWGDHFASGVSGGHVALWFHKPAPERSTRSLTRVAPQNVAADVQVTAARLLYSDDDVNFMTVARMPTTTHHRSYVVLYGDEILVFNRAGGINASPKGIWSMPAPAGLGAHRGLSIAPGGTNLLSASGGVLSGATAGAGTVLTPITGGLHPVTGAPLDTPGQGPVYRVQSDGSSSLLLSFNPTAGTPVAPGFAYMPLWIRVIGPEGVSSRVALTDNGGQSEQVAWTRHQITTRDQWVPYPIMLSTAAFQGDYAPKVRLISDSGSSRCDFLILIDGFYAGQMMPYSTTPGTTSPPEQVTQPLGAGVGATWTVGLDLNVPWSSEDWLGHPSAALDGGRLYLATIFADDDNYAELYADLGNMTIGVDVRRDGAPAGSAAVGDIALQRGDRLWVALAQSSPTATVLYAWSGGSTETGLVGATCPAGLAAEPVEIRLGSADFSRIPSIDALMVGVQTNRALGSGGVIDLLSSE